MDSHDIFPKVMDLLLDAVCAVDAQGRYVYVNAACEHMFGYPRDELIGRNMIELVHPDDRDRTLEAAQKVMRGNSHLHFENRYVRKDGTVVDVMWSATWSEADRMRLAVARDVTELKRAQRVQSAVYRISEAAHTVEGLSALYEQIHRIIGELLPADNFFVAMYDISTGMLSFPYFVDARKRKPDPTPLVENTPLAEVIHTGEAVLITSAGTAGADTDAQSTGDYLDWLGVPLISNKDVMGALVVQSYSGHVRYDEEDKELLHYVSTQIGTAIDRKLVESRLLYMARHDPLTDLPNRILFQDRLDTALRRARRDREHLALLYLDIDDFKQVNDSFGHNTGDRLLRELARRIVHSVRESDTIGRMGGDEFTVLLSNIQGPEDVEAIVEKIHTAINTPFEVDGHTLTVSASIGTAVYPEHGDDQDQLMRHADTDMYSMKRNKVEA